MASKGPGSKTDRTKDRLEELKYQRGLTGGRIARRAQRRLDARIATFDGMKDQAGYRRPGSSKGHV
jgi:hypothetical protein